MLESLSFTQKIYTKLYHSVFRFFGMDNTVEAHNSLKFYSERYQICLSLEIDSLLKTINKELENLETKIDDLEYPDSYFFQVCHNLAFLEFVHQN